MANTSVTSIYPERLLEDLAKSGLEPQDVRAKPISPAEKAATHTPMGIDGYVLPYFSIEGKPIQFYRVRLYDTEPKYKQLADSPNHVYFPPRLVDLLPNAKYLILTEGEKKAAAAVKLGFPTVAVSGADSWRNRTIHLPKSTSLAQRANGAVSAKIGAGENIYEGFDTIAIGLQSVIDFVVERNIPLIICFDHDADQKVNYNVARAAATLGFELRFRGVGVRNIRHMVLDARGKGKIGLDDYLEDPEYGPDALGRLIQANLQKKSAFPKHPNTKEFVNKRLQRPHIPRHEQMALAMAILSDLDARGQRLRAPDEGALFYFSDKDKALTKVEFTNTPEFAETPFGIKLYQDYNLSWTDQRILGWLMTQYSGEEPISDVYPERVLTWRGDTLYFQINAGQMVKVTAKGIEVLDNGTDGVLFESGLVEDISDHDFKTALHVQQQRPLENQWLKVLNKTRIRDTNDQKHKALLSLLYYMSPYFYRWRGTQLPVEITTGEAGSGKSTLYELRLSILTGVPTLRNAPSDLRDWNAGLASAGALHVTDNVQLANADLRTRLSDEICRLVTEPKPTIEQRKLYTNTGLIKIPVKCVFAITAIKQPFSAVDIIQRSIITEMDKGVDADLKYDARWKERQIIEFGGRAHWIAHQLLVVQHMLRLIGERWDNSFQARYRLINAEQLLVMAAQVFGSQDSGSWIPEHLEGTRDKRISEGDWTMEGLKAFKEYMRDKLPGARFESTMFTASDIQQWALGEEEFEDCQLLKNTRMLGRYIATNKHSVASIAGIIPGPVVGGKQMYKFRETHLEQFEAHSASDQKEGS